ncbi:MAG TPA: trimethylamine methyltransferase family protein, partial [Roseiflexaceae bacterium]|nr:trimethylamine methyltransferase family protein [Roseiflexaceae bacterium]
RHAAATPQRTSQIIYDLPVYALLGPEGEQRLHDASMRILAELGIDFYDEEVRAILKDHGAEVRGETVFLSEELVMRYVAMAPAQFVQRARNPQHNVTIGGNHMVFAPVYGPPFVQDLAGGRRDATLADFQNFVRLACCSPYIHHSGGTIVEPTDEPVATRHLDMLLSHIIYNDKAFMGSVTSGPNAADSVRMAEIVFGAAAIREQPALLSLINVSSPRRYDERMLAAIKTYARARQALLITPFILAGAMGPVSIAGTVAQLNAEALAGIALVQMIEPGCPVVYGSFLSTIDLQSGSPTMGTPESQVGLYLSAQLARRYGLPFRGGGMFASSKLPDAQAGYESVMVMLPTIMARTNFVLHAAGWLENGLVAGYEKFVLDCEILGMLHTWARGVDLSDEALAFDAMLEVPPGGHYLGAQHTLRHFRDAFYRAELFDYNSAEQWELNGAEDSYARAAKKVRALLASYEPPPLDPSVLEELQAFVARRKEEIAREPRDF